MAATPPMQTAIHTPPTPLHGARYDSYQPYSTRKSTRQSTQRSQRAAQTPPPQSSDSDSRHLLAPISKTESAGYQLAHTYSPPSSTHTSPENKLLGNRNYKKPKDSSFNTSMPSDLPPAYSGVNMLPTPAKTPRKKQIQAPAIAPTARVLFPVQPETAEEETLTPRKRGRKRKQAGFSLNNSMGNDIAPEDRIQIFTDSKEKVPELDPSEDNPFYDNTDHSKLYKEPSITKNARKRKLKPSTNEYKEVEEAFEREEGMVYVFRGKKIYRKFSDESDTEAQTSFTITGNNTDIGSVSSPRLRPLTRSSIKPRLLFPTAPQRSLGNKDDEEAVTDIEEMHSIPNDSEMTDFAPDIVEEVLVTPVKTSFTRLATPPTTGYATRAAMKKALDSSSPIGPEPVELSGPSLDKLGKKLSPFDGWQRTKSTRKRGSEVLEKDKEGNKRIKEYRS